MLESFISFEEIEKKPYMIFLWAFLLTSVAIIVSSQIDFQISLGSTIVSLSGIFSVMFTIIPSVYFVTTLIQREEEMEEKQLVKLFKKGIWARHGKDIILLLIYFFGVTFAFAVWAFFLPETFFQIQNMKISEIVGKITGLATNSINSFEIILLNNISVMAFSFIFALLFGAGAMFIIVWNASILGIYIARLSESIIHIPSVATMFIPHGVPEIASYIAATIAGGIISAAIIRGHHQKGVLPRILLDAALIMGLALVLVIGAAYVEVYL